MRNNRVAWEVFAFGIFGFCAAAVVAVYLTGSGFESSDGADSLLVNSVLELPEDSASRVEPGSSVSFGPSSSLDRFVSRIQGSLEPIGSEATADVYLFRRPGEAPDSTETIGSPVLSSTELEPIQQLHSVQQAELERQLADLGAVLLGTGDGAGREMTLGEVRSLHEQQGREAGQGEDRIVVPGGSDDFLAPTVGDVRALQRQQAVAMQAESRESAYRMRLPGTDAVLTRGEVVALHERQGFELENDTKFSYTYPTVPAGDGGQFYLTVDEIRDLHSGQVP
jgi:hypothetical protein